MVVGTATANRPCPSLTWPAGSLGFGRARPANLLDSPTMGKTHLNRHDHEAKDVQVCDSRQEFTRVPFFPRFFFIGQIAKHFVYFV